MALRALRLIVVLGMGERDEMERFIWRLRFTIYGQKKCPIGWRNWWAFSADTEWGWHDSPEEAADEELYAMAADA